MTTARRSRAASSTPRYSSTAASGGCSGTISVGPSRTGLAEALLYLDRSFGRDRVDRTLHTYLELYPRNDAEGRGPSPADYLAAETAGIPNAEHVLGELLLLWLASANAAFAPCRELFDDARLEQAAGYREIVASLEPFFASRPPAASGGQNLFQVLRQPVREDLDLRRQLELLAREGEGLPPEVTPF